MQHPLRSLTHAERGAKFGRLDFVIPDPNKDDVRLAVAWTRANLTTVWIPQIPGPKTQSSGPLFRGRTITVNKTIVEPLKALWAAWEAAGLLPLIHTWNGSFVPRLKRGVRAPGYEPRAKDLSNHSYGLAFDINAADYPLGTALDTTDQDSRSGRSRWVRDMQYGQLIPIAEAHGFLNGNQFSRPDPMHFEWGVPSATP